jgi:hypothetical protein
MCDYWHYQLRKRNQEEEKVFILLEGLGGGVVLTSSAGDLLRSQRVILVRCPQLLVTHIYNCTVQYSSH